MSGYKQSILERQSFSEDEQRFTNLQKNKQTHLQIVEQYQNNAPLWKIVKMSNI